MQLVIDGDIKHTHLNKGKKTEREIRGEKGKKITYTRVSINLPGRHQVNKLTCQTYDDAARTWTLTSYSLSSLPPPLPAAPHLPVGLPPASFSFFYPSSLCLINNGSFLYFPRFPYVSAAGIYSEPPIRAWAKAMIM